MDLKGVKNIKVKLNYINYIYTFTINFIILVNLLIYSIISFSFLNFNIFGWMFSNLIFIFLNFKRLMPLGIKVFLY